MANTNAWTIPVGIKLVIIIEDKKIKMKNVKVYMNNLEPNSSVFSHDSPIDWNILLSSYIMWAANKENLAERYIPGRINIKYPSAAAIVTII